MFHPLFLPDDAGLLLSDKFLSLRFILVSYPTAVMKCPVVKWQKGQSYRPILVQYADTTKSIVSKAYGRSPEEQIPAGSHSVIRGLVTNRLMVTPGALQSKAADSKYRCYRHVTDS